MTAINNWFSKHNDAILVSDKVNEPNLFSSQFIDKRRLIMELFTMEAVKEGLAAGILSAMPSMHVVKAMEGDKVTELKALGIKHITFSIFNLYEHRSFLEEARKKGIKTYIYNLNYKTGKNEAYMLCNELDRVYGMYADSWDFRNF